MGYKRYVKEKAAQAKRKATFNKKKEFSKSKNVKEMDEELVPHPTAPRAFIIKKKPNA